MNNYKSNSPWRAVGLNSKWVDGYFLVSIEMGWPGLEPEMPFDHGFTVRYNTNSAHQPLWPQWDLNPHPRKVPGLNRLRIPVPPRKQKRRPSWKQDKHPKIYSIKELPWNGYNRFILFLQYETKPCSKTYSASSRSYAYKNVIANVAFMSLFSFPCFLWFHYSRQFLFGKYTGSILLSTISLKFPLFPALCSF